MKVVLDTNVIVYELLGTRPFDAECNELFATATELLAPASWEPELTNVLWLAVRARSFSVEAARERLSIAAALGIRSVPVTTLWSGALQRACDSGVAAYDTIFVELADREGAPLATFDAAVLKAFPKIAKRPRAILRAA